MMNGKNFVKIGGTKKMNKEEIKNEIRIAELLDRVKKEQKEVEENVM